MPSESTPVVRGETASFVKLAQNIERPLRLSQHGSLFVSQFEPKYMEFARARRLYGANTGAGTAIAPVTAVPTTAAAWALYNPTTSSRILVPLKVYCYSVSGTLGLGMSLLAAIPPSVVATAPTAYASSVNNSISPNAQTSTAIFGQGVTIAAPVWNVLAARDQVSAVSVGSGLSADTDGMFLIEPGFCLAATVLAPAGTSALFGVGFIWGELDLDLG
jgi:hypothetical protein